MTHRTDLERFWSKVDQSGDCWIWTAGKTGGGYGCFWFNGFPHQAHRWIYGQVRPGATTDPESHIDHLCRNRACVRPDHLEEVSERENILRGTAPTAVNARKTHCNKGHEYTPENTELRPCGRRRCITCRKAYRSPSSLARAS